MYLKSLTLKGFKSFADPTTLELQPGVTVVVGPNGSGKSNVVDAVAWALGAQGPRTMRSSKMDDVIFAGTEQRAALGRAEVTLTIDNSSRRIPVDFNEITVTRTLFRSGESEYALNGVACRLLDVQELLSDSGVGRQQHVIVSQGQLDSLLSARPEDRRAVVEEAAGVLKYRRRRERAERRLESSEASLARLQDLLREVRRQLRPLERQAASAFRHEELAMELRALRLYLAGRELVELEERVGKSGDEAARLEALSSATSAELSRIDAQVAHEQSGFTGERAEDLTPIVSRLERLAERALGLVTLAEERRRAKAALFAASLDAEEVAGLEAELSRTVADLAACEAEAASLVPEWEALVAKEEELSRQEQLDEARFAPAPGELDGVPIASLRAEHQGARDGLAAAREGAARAAERADALAARRSQTDERLASANAALEELAPALEVASNEAELANGALADAEAAVIAATEERRASDEERHGARGRVEALSLALEEVRARAGIEHLAGLPGVLGTLLDVVEVDEGTLGAFESAVEGALGVVLVAEGGDARGALEHLRRAGKAGTVLPVRLVPGIETRPSTTVALAGTEALLGRVHSKDRDVQVLLERLLDGILLSAYDFEGALAQALEAPLSTIVTTAGDRFSPFGWRLGAGTAGATRAVLDAAQQAEAAAAARSSDAESTELERRALLADARSRATTTLRRLDQLGADQARALADREAAQVLKDGQLGEEEAALDERARAVTAIDSAAQLVEDLAHRLAAAQLEEDARSLRRREQDEAREARDQRTRALSSLRRDLEVRVAALEERRSLLTHRHAELTSRLSGRIAQRERAKERRSAHEGDDVALGRLHGLLIAHEAEARAAAVRFAAERDRRASATRARLDLIASLRTARDDLERSLMATRERHQRLEIDMTEARVRREGAIESLERDLGAVLEEAVAAPRPELAPGVEPAIRILDVEREIRLLGPVNPLAREELIELEERNGFLEAQLEDVKAARRELGQVIRAVDAEIVEVFAAAYEDLEAHFADLFTTLFPGGTGRLSLTNPEDLLTTGIEIEARPAGRNVRRLSLLSGGERSLVAMAFLFAVFRTRPSPFYLLDEVEAALDELNLRRFLGLLDQFRAESQLIVVSHQKRTMEIADALYGVSMQPGGGSKVVSEKLRNPAEIR